MSKGSELSSDLLSVMADGIGDLSFASAEWVEAAQEVLTAAAVQHADGLANLESRGPRRAFPLQHSVLHAATATVTLDASKRFPVSFQCGNGRASRTKD